MNTNPSPRYVVARSRFGYTLVDSSVKLEYLGEGNDGLARESSARRFLANSLTRAPLDAKARELNRKV